MPLFAQLVSNSAFKNGGTCAIIEGNRKPIRVKRIIRGDKTNFIVFVFSEHDRPGLEYTGEITVPDHPVVCLEGSFCGNDEFLTAKTKALEQLCTLGKAEHLRVTGPIADYTKRVGNLHSVAIEGQSHEITVWHLESHENGLAKFWFACKAGIWRAESLLATHQGVAAKATF